MSQATANEIIAHYGVKGMRWGRRKTGTSSTARTQFVKAPKKLSTEELVRRIGRMEAEKKYNSLNRGDISPGRQAANEILTTTGKRVASTVLTGASLLAIKTAVDAKFGGGAGSAVTRRLK